MARLSSDQWEQVRTERETSGTSFGVLADKFHVNKAAIVRRAKAECWSDGTDLNETINRKVTEKVTGIVTGGDPKKKAAAVAVEVDRRAGVLKEHQREWDEVEAIRQKVFEVLNGGAAVTEPAEDGGGTVVLNPVKGAFELAKLAKIMAEQTHIKQAGQRKAYGLDAKEDSKRDGVANLADALRQARERAASG